MPRYVLFPLSLVLLTIKIWLFPMIGWKNVSPDLVIILCVYAALHDKGKRAIFNCWILGLVQDVFSCEQFGVFSFLFAFLGFLLLRFKEEFFFNHMFFFILLVFIFSLQCNFLHACLILSLYGTDVFGNIFPSAICTAVVVPLMLPVLRFFPSFEKKDADTRSLLK